ncbi:MAG: hypothetical protein MI725_14830 [Pirellulales bacterium]|nr:hypothetical protein [Pirellulales bacterium]
MKNHLNLMSEQARIRECLRNRWRQWKCFWAVTLAVLGVVGVVTWWPAYRESRHRASLEEQYEPVRLMKAENQSLKQQIQQLRDQEKFVLELSDGFPLVTLLGIVGQTVDKSQGQVFVEELAFEAGDSAGDEPMASLSLVGLGVNRSAVTRLTDSLQTAIPFASVQLQSQSPTQVNQQSMHKFSIQCFF